MRSTSKVNLIGRILMTMATLMYGLIPPFVDLTETHVFHPDWTPHARMHMVWLLGTNSTLAVVALFFLWLYRENSAFGVRLAGVLGLCVYGGFMLSAATTSLVWRFTQRQRRSPSCSRDGCKHLDLFAGAPRAGPWLVSCSCQERLTRRSSGVPNSRAHATLRSARCIRHGDSYE